MAQREIAAQKKGGREKKHGILVLDAIA